MLLYVVVVVIGTWCVHKNVLLLLLVHSRCTFGAKKGIVVVVSAQCVDHALF